MSETIGMRLKKFRKRAKLTQEQAAKRLDVSPGAISKWEKGDNSLRADNLISLSRLYGVSPEMIVTGQDGDQHGDGQGVIISGGFEEWDDQTPLEQDEVEIPLFSEVELAAGSGLYSVQEDAGKRLRFSKRTLARSGVDVAAAACAIVSGDSMEPVLPDGACVGVDTSNTNIKDGDMYCIDHGGLLRVKILNRLPGGGIAIKSINPAYALEELTHQQVIDGLRVIGRIFWYSALR